MYCTCIIAYARRALHRHNGNSSMRVLFAIYFIESLLHSDFPPSVMAERVPFRLKHIAYIVSEIYSLQLSKITFDSTFTLTSSAILTFACELSDWLLLEIFRRVPAAKKPPMLPRPRARNSGGCICCICVLLSRCYFIRTFIQMVLSAYCFTHAIIRVLFL